MSIYKRPGSKFYWCRFTYNGREIRQSCETTNKQEARDVEAEIRSRLRDGRIGIDNLSKKSAKAALTFNEAMQNYLDNLTVKESTKRRYEVASKALLAYFNNAIVSTIDGDDVERFRSWRSKQKKKAPHKRLEIDKKAKTDKPIKPATINREITLLSSLFSRLIRKGKVRTNPVKSLERAKLAENNIQNRVLTNEEFRAYLMACSQPLRDVAAVMWETGMRPSEVYNLRKPDVDLEQGRINISEGKTKAARRSIAMSETVYAIIAHRFDQAKGELLFPGGKLGEKETPIAKLTNAHNAAIDRVNKAAKETGNGITIKPFHQYDLRHGFCTHLTQSGVDLMTASALMGHSRLEMMKRYSHPTEQHQADAITRLENFRNQDTNVKAFRRSA